MFNLNRNKRFLLVVATYGTFVGPPVAWITILDFSLLPLDFHQDKAMWVGIMAVLVSGVSPIIMGRFNDLLQGHIKTLLITLMLATTAFCYWFLLLSYGILEVTDWQVYTSVIGICACNYAALPLFFEVAVDIAFPVSDILVTGVMTAADCLASTLFLTLYSIPNIETKRPSVVAPSGRPGNYAPGFGCSAVFWKIRNHSQVLGVAESWDAEFGNFNLY
ncbi:Disrupted in renal carcinoma protein 2 [Chionoecetes opilio]|uniref:Disrupted in renal carcinoma protein 2 n=1 Tax=Chionoecetes opilio TaxID=41210 RepID=A0A8J5CGY3_CHIOP|nr:Disrupted in renal carcinoma protein 2 [Chionoecetes opilio]